MELFKFQALTYNCNSPEPLATSLYMYKYVCNRGIVLECLIRDEYMLVDSNSPEPLATSLYMYKYVCNWGIVLECLIRDEYMLVDSIAPFRAL